MLTNCLLFNTKKLERQLSKIAEEEFSKINIHHSYAYILTVIEDYGVVKTKEIAYELGLASSTVTRMVGKLEDDGYVIKGTKNSKVDISLSEKGKKLMPEITKCWIGFHKRYEKVLTEEEVGKLNELTTRIEVKCKEKC